MKKTILFIFSLFSILLCFSQENIKFTNDLGVLKQQLLQKDYLFTHYSKAKFIEQINNLTKKESFFEWHLNKIIRNFKVLDFKIEAKNNIYYPFKITVFNDRFYITEIDKKHSFLLGFELLAINDFSIKQLKEKFKTIFYLPHNSLVNCKMIDELANKSLLAFLKINVSEKIMLTLQNNKLQHTVSLSFLDFDNDELVKLSPKKELFNERKEKSWFWKYGINFGKQVFLKYQVCASKEHIALLNDSLNISAKTYAKMYDLPLQEVYDAPKFNLFINKVVEKFKKKRYKKLIIDLRNTKKGAFLSSKYLLDKVMKTKRINKNNRLFILVNKRTNNASLQLIKAFKNNTKVTVLGETTFGNLVDYKTITIKLPNSKLQIRLPLEKPKEILIEPNVLVKTTINQYKNGVDALLQYAIK